MWLVPFRGCRGVEGNKRVSVITGKNPAQRAGVYGGWRSSVPLVRRSSHF